MIEIFEPRYRDRTVLIAAYKVRAGENVKIKILKGYYAGDYVIDSGVIKDASREKMKTKRGGEITVLVVPLDKLTKEGE